MCQVNLGAKLVLIQHFALLCSSNISSEAHIHGPSLSALLYYRDSLHVHPKDVPKEEGIVKLSGQKNLFLLQKKEYSVSGPVLNHCHREGREEYDCANSAWTFSEGDCNLTRPEEDDDDIVEDEPLVM